MLRTCVRLPASLLLLLLLLLPLPLLLLSVVEVALQYHFLLLQPLPPRHGLLLDLTTNSAMTRSTIATHLTARTPHPPLAPRDPSYSLDATRLMLPSLTAC